jgi:nicotinamide mononucleotide transporter
MPSFLEVFAVVTGIATVALAARGHIANWPIGIVSSAVFLVVFLEAGLYADTLLQGLYVVLGCYGWWAWLFDGPKRSELPVSFAPGRLRLVLGLAAVAGTAGFGFFLDATTDSTVPYPDAATTVLSLVAQLLLTRKHVDNWPVWIFGVNVPYIGLYLYKGLALTAALQLVFIALSASGWRRWLRELHDRRADAVVPTPALERAA